MADSGRAITTAARAAEAKHEREMLEMIDERDRAEQWADRLAYAIAPMERIGEHSNLHNPWAEALDALDERDAWLVRDEHDRLRRQIEALERYECYFERGMEQPDDDEPRGNWVEIGAVLALLGESTQEQANKEER